MKYNFRFVVGSQFLYGPEVLETVESRAKEMAAELSKVLPYPLTYKVTAKTNKEITDVVKEANYDDSCAGIVPRWGAVPQRSGLEAEVRGFRAKSDYQDEEDSYVRNIED